MSDLNEIQDQLSALGQGVAILQPLANGLAACHAELTSRARAVNETEIRQAQVAHDLVEREKKVANREAALDGVRQQLADEKARRQAAIEREARLAVKLDEVKSEKNVLANQLGKIKNAFPQLIPTT